MRTRVRLLGPFPLRRRYLLLAFSERLFQPFGLQDCISTLGTCVEGNCYTAVKPLGISAYGLAVIGILFLALFEKWLFSQWTKAEVKRELVRMKELGMLSTSDDLRGESQTQAPQTQAPATIKNESWL